MQAITQKEYWEEVDSLADMIIDECAEYDTDLYEYTHECVDGHQWIIYTAQHEYVLRHCSNEDAWQDVFGNEDMGAIVAAEGLDHARMVQAFYAFLEDVQAAVSEKGE